MAVKQNERSGETQQQQAQDTRRSSNDKRMVTRNLPALMSPFALLDRFFNDELAGLFGQPDRGRLEGANPDARAQPTVWAPKVDVIQRGQELVVRADLPGVKRDDVQVEVSDDAITISGERQEERKEEEGGTYRLERSYGAFLRTIPLPEGALVDQAKATFKDGVLEITVPAPPEQVSRGRRLEISHGEDTNNAR